MSTAYNKIKKAKKADKRLKATGKTAHTYPKKVKT